MLGHRANGSNANDAANSDLFCFAVPTGQRPDLQADIGDAKRSLAHRVRAPAGECDPPLRRMGERIAQLVAGAEDVVLEIQFGQRRLEQCGHGHQG